MSNAFDTPALRKARGAFFTPDAIAEFIVEWAIRSPSDRVLEPSAGDAAFLVPAVRTLKSKAENSALFEPTVYGVEIHADSAAFGDRRVAEVGGRSVLTVADFFDIEADGSFDAVIGNPPYIRYQDFAGDSRVKARAAALRAGVSISGLASSWAAFVVHSARFLSPGGRLGFVLPAELLSVNYAAPVRKFLFENFESVDLVLFTERVFAEAEADVVLLLADGYGRGPADHARIAQALNAETLRALPLATRWAPTDPASKWTPSLLDRESLHLYSSLLSAGHFTDLRSWGRTTLGAVTGDNSFFALSDARVHELGLEQTDLVQLSPPGSTHLRGLSYSAGDWRRQQLSERRVWLFRPTVPSRNALRYIAEGERLGVDSAYKCRVRSPWWRVPVSRTADLFLTYMNSDSVRLSANSARVKHLNSVHGVNLHVAHRAIGKPLLALGSLSSMTLLGAELMGRAYGGGLLKVEPREADLLPMPAPDLLARSASQLRQIAAEVKLLLRKNDLLGASTAVDRVLFSHIDGPGSEINAARLREARAIYAARRTARSAFRGVSPATR